MNSNLEKLLLKQDQLNAQIKDLQSRQKQQKRKADTRVKILLGGALIATIRSGQIRHTNTILELKNNIKNKKDSEFIEKWITSNLDL